MQQILLIVSIDFIDVLQARQKFEIWQTSQWLGPSGLLEKKEVQVRKAYLPFWCFDTRLAFQYSASVGHMSDNGTVVWETEKREGSLPTEQYRADNHLTQVYGSYKYRRDLVKGVQSCCSTSGRPMDWLEAHTGCVKQLEDVVHIDSPDLRQGIAWELALRSVRKHMVCMVLVCVAVMLFRALAMTKTNAQIIEMSSAESPLLSCLTVLYAPTCAVCVCAAEIKSWRGVER